MTWNEHGGRLGEEFFTPGFSSFTEFLLAHRPELLSTRRVLPDGVRAAPDQVPHGTTVLALSYRDGVLIAGDRRATMGNLIAQRDLEKVHPADDHTAVAFAGTVGLALDMVKLYQVELTHFEKIEGVAMTLDGKARRLAGMIRQNLGQAMQGLAVVPLLIGYDPSAPEGERGRIFSFDIAERTLREDRLPRRGLRIAVCQRRPEETVPQGTRPPRGRPRRAPGAVGRGRRRLRDRRPRHQPPDLPHRVRHHRGRLRAPVRAGDRSPQPRDGRAAPRPAGRAERDALTGHFPQSWGRPVAGFTAHDLQVPEDGTRLLIAAVPTEEGSSAR